MHAFIKEFQDQAVTRADLLFVQPRGDPRLGQRTAKRVSKVCLILAGVRQERPSRAAAIGGLTWWDAGVRVT